MRDRFLQIALCVLVCSSIPASAQVTFEFITSPVGPTWFNFALNKDGSVMAANYGGEIFRWTATDGFVDLGMGDFLNSSIGISGDGLSIVAGRVGPDGLTNPALWQKGKGWIDLGHPADGCSVDNNWGSGYGLNSDGTIAVGL